MKIDIEFEAQLREVAGQQRMSVELPDGQTLSHAIQAATEESDALRNRLLTPAGDLQPSVMVFINEQPVAAAASDAKTLNNGDTVLLLPPISGG